MRSNERLQRILALRDLGGGAAAASCAATGPGSAFVRDLRLFTLTFAGGFLFMTIFLA